MKTGFAVVGAGLRGRRLAEEMVTQGEGVAEIRAWSDPNPANLESARERFPDAATAGDYQAVVERDDISGVIVASPNAFHADAAVLALEHGKHVFCEKPMATTVEDCQRILEAAERAGNILHVGFVLRYAPVFVKLKELIESGEIGDPLLFNWLINYPGGIHYYRTWHRLKAWSGGLNVEKACHDYDLLNWYFDDLPERVVMWSGLNKFVPGSKKADRCDECDDRCEDYADELREGKTTSTPDGQLQDGSSNLGCFYNTPKDIGDHYVGLLEYAGGLRGTVQMCFYTSSPYGREFIIVGSMGEIRGNLHDAVLEVHYRDRKNDSRRIDLRRASRGGHSGGDWRQMRAFLDAVRTGEPSLNRGVNGVKAVLVGCAMERSIQEDRPIRPRELVDERWLTV